MILGPSGGVGSLPRPEDIAPFPVDAPVRIKPDLVKLGSAPLFLEDCQWRDWIEEKIRAICSGRPCFIAADWLSAKLLDQLWLELSRQIQSAPKGLATKSPVLVGAELPWIGYLAQSAVERFLALSLSIQEDFAVMVNDGQGGLRAGLLSVFFPSGWRPQDKIGQRLQQIHAPVPENGMLQASTPAMGLAMTSKGPFVRHVWTLSGSPARGRQPGESTVGSGMGLKDLWFRCERQVTVPLGGLGCLFLIRVFVTRLEPLLADPAKKQALRAALLSMSDELVQYKGIDQARSIVLEATA